ncbi:excisionase [Rhodococcus sp. 06-462-5]|uniref:DUF2637 domain-containing protein n=1 Tax=unclassified Rhodococcus (in: high G+C Gram-positive bacteria) TaxID=192944 RepID=UPI000B9B7129|nr:MULTISPECIES: DUF2637 domain-containing protein [unclassified Rhodococcus (in: high G+C Gram-positive bacteria)]OZC69825.1 excisionase [Rhodococcus sp. 06-462-5]OZE58521.1 excisionase [Rhodococcus sp. 02-925g]
MNKVLRATLVSAVVITTVIGIASFVLSFAALWDLATMAGVPRSLSWLWPVIVDGTILQATISVIALAQFEDQRSGRRFFWGVLITAALVSIGANAMHAFISDAGTLHPALSAAIATVAPVSLLAATHGLGILVRVPAELPKTTGVAEEELAVEEPAITVPRSEPVTPAPELPTSETPAPAPMKRVEPVHTEPERIKPEHIQPVRIEQPMPEPAVRTIEPLDEVDRWILDEERVDDLYPVDAP